MGENHSYDLILIGYAIAGRCVYKALREFDPNLNILILDAPRKLTSCSMRTTGVVVPSGIKKGISPLGDLLVDGFKSFESFVFQQKPRGIYPHKQFHLYPQDSNKREQFLKRYGEVHDLDTPFLKDNHKGFMEEGFLVEEQEFLNWWDQKFPAKVFKKVVNSIDCHKVKTHEGDEYIGKKIVLCTGAYSHLMPLVHEHKKFMGKPIPGHYYTWDNVDYGQDSFVLSLGGHNLVYRAFSKQLLLGGSTEADGIFAPRVDFLNQYYSKFQDLISMPPLSGAKSAFGIRQKGQKRHPFCGLIHTDVYGLSSLYKNGWSLPFFLSNQLVRTIYPC